MAELLTVHAPSASLQARRISVTITPRICAATSRAGRISVELSERPVSISLLPAPRISCELRLEPTRLVQLMRQGPAGRDGVSEGLTGIAARALSGHRAMTYDAAGLVTYAQPGDVVAGITRHAYVTGETVLIQTSGLMVESSWMWTPGGDVFLASGGILTQTVPEGGMMQVLGRAISPTSLLICIQQNISLSN